MIDRKELPDRVRIVEVGPRDGLQNESAPIPLDAKVRFVDGLTDAGLASIEVGSFVSPSRVPEMADTAGVFARIRRKPGVAYSALVPNQRGMDAAIDAGADAVAVFAAASETFSQKNAGGSIAETLKRFAPVCATARERSIPVRGYVSTVLGCPYEGDVSPDRVAELAARLVDMGCMEISLGDTIGVGTPLAVVELLRVVSRVVPVDRLAVHFHDTHGQALANILAVLPLGIRTIDASAGGLGGCPYAPGASGNVATEDVVYMLHGMGIETGVDLDALVETTWIVSDAVGRPPVSRVARALGRAASRT